MAEDTVTALRQLAAAFEGDGCVAELAYDVRRIADALDRLSDCVREDANGIPYLNISPEVNDG